MKQRETLAHKSAVLKYRWDMLILAIAESICLWKRKQLTKQDSKTPVYYKHSQRGCYPYKDNG